MAIDFFGTEREDIQLNKFPKLKLKKDETIRVGLIHHGDNKFFIGTKVHVRKGGPIFSCLSTKEKKEICCTHIWEGRVPRYRIGCIIIKYDIEKNTDGKIKIKSYELIPWLFWESMYNKLKSIDAEFPITKHDLKLSCTNADYQLIDITPYKESIWSSSKEMQNKVIKEAEPLFNSIKEQLAKELSISEIEEVLGIQTEKKGTVEIDISKAIESLE
jgi:hypothetical protein